MSSGTRFRVAICGAGIAGLTTAVALSSYSDIEVDIFEGAEKLAELGAGIGLFSRPWEVIKKLDLDEELLNFTEAKQTDGPVSTFQYRKSDRPEGIEFYSLITKGSLMTFHRPDFQKVLLGRLSPSHRIHCSKRLRSYTELPDGQIGLLFEDGTKYTCDVLLGADGVKSAVRRSLLTAKAHRAQRYNKSAEASELLSKIDPTWSGTNAYRSVIPADKLRKRCPNHRVFTQQTIYLGKNGYIIAYPISHGKMINCVAFKSRYDLENTTYNGPWVSPTEKEEFLAMFRHWEPEAQVLLDCMERPLRWAIHTVKPLDSFVSGNVALLGDAAHAMTPHQGSGAGQAIEDAYILGLLLGHRHTRKETLSRTLSVYDHIRRPFAQKVHELANSNGRYFTLNCREVNFDAVPDHHLPSQLKSLGQAFTRNWEWAWNTSLGTSVQEAIRLMES